MFFIMIVEHLCSTCNSVRLMFYFFRHRRAQVYYGKGVSNMDKKFYTVQEFFELTGHAIAKNTIYKYIRDGKIPAKRFGDRHLILASFVDEFMNNPAFNVE